MRELTSCCQLFLLTTAFDGLPNQFSLMWKITSSILSNHTLNRVVALFSMLTMKHFQIFVYQGKLVIFMAQFDFSQFEVNKKHISKGQ